MIECHIGEASGQAISFTVLDEGPGMSKADCTEAVERFWRRGPASAGSGLGLSIVTAIAAYGGGTLELRPKQVGEGLEARLTLPRIPYP